MVQVFISTLCLEVKLLFSCLPLYMIFVAAVYIYGDTRAGYTLICLP